VRGLDRNEIALIMLNREAYWGVPHGLGAAAKRLVKRGVLVWVPCPAGCDHEHLEGGPNMAAAVRCHIAAYERVDV
jgi:hypothetical protein